MSSSRRKRRSFTAEYRVEAAHRVIDIGRTITEVGRSELGLGEPLLGNGFGHERRRMGAATAHSEEPPNAAERAELSTLRKRVSEQDKDIPF